MGATTSGTDERATGHRTAPGTGEPQYDTPQSVEITLKNGQLLGDFPVPLFINHGDRKFVIKRTRNGGLQMALRD